MIQWPSRNGLPAHPSIVELPPSRLPNREHNLNNHHLLFPRRRYEMGGIIYATLRDLDAMQVDMPKDVHNTGKNTLHCLYGPPQMPTPGRAVDFILDQFEAGESLRTGTCREPLYTQISPELMGQILNASFTEARRNTR